MKTRFSPAVFFFAVAALASMPVAAYDNISLAGTVPFKKVVSHAAGIAASPRGSIFIADAAGTVRVFSPEGKPAGTIGAKGKGADQLSEPQGLAVDADGNLYVADAGRHRVAVFSAEGKFLRALGTRGAGAGQLSSPRGVAVAADGVVYVADTGNNRVQVFSSDGVFLLGFGGPGEGLGQFKEPTAVTFSPAGRVYVMDQKRVQSFTASGQFLALLERPKVNEKDKEPPTPQGLAADAFGALYVAGSHQKVEEYGPDGKYVAAFGTYGSGAGQFKGLSALSVAPSGVIYALDGDLNRAQGFTLVSADRAAPIAPGPTLRFSVKPLESRLILVDDLAFAGDVLVGVGTKGSKVLYSADRGAGLAWFAGSRGKGPDQVNVPSGVFARDRQVLIADEGNERVLLWGADGKPAAQSAIGSAGKREGQFKAPHAVALDAQGRVFVADPTLARVQMFSPDGIFLSSLPGSFQSPVDVAPLPKGVVVLDAGKKTLFFFDEKGKAAGQAVETFQSPVSIATDPRGKLGFVYVLDAGADQVKVVSRRQVVASFGSAALFNGPKAVAVDDRGVLWVADAAGLKSFEVRLVPLAPGAFEAKPGEGQVKLSWSPDPEAMAAGFVLYRSTQPEGGKTPVQVFSSTETTFLDREIVPGLTYYYALTAVATDGAGKNPLEGPRARAQTTTVRPANLPPVEIASIELANIFSAQYKFYEKNPVGRVLIKNNTEKTFQKIRVGFTLQNYMDFVTEKVIDRFEPGALESLDLKATLNNKILSVTEDTPIQAQLTITYYDNGDEKVFKRAEPLTLYGRNAVSWENPAQVATFITDKDPALLEFSHGAVHAFAAELDATPVNPNIAKAAVLFNTLGAHGVGYLKDPNAVFDQVSGNPKVIDYVEYPRETLKRKTGKCSDLTVLYAAMLESVGVPAAVVDVPGHVLVLFQVDEEAPLDPGVPEDQAIRRDEVLWIPVEVTRVGKSFADAWAEGARVVKSVPEDRIHVYEVEDAWNQFPPATLPEEAGPAVPAKAEVAAKFPDALKSLAQSRLDALTARYEAVLKQDPKSEDAAVQLGLVNAENGNLDKSAEWFDKVLALNPANASALNNRGNIAWLKGDAAKAREFYGKAAAADLQDAGVRLNLARAAWKAGDKAGAKKAYDDALGLNPALKKDFTSLQDAVK